MYIAGGKSLREISMELGMSRQAVTIIVRESEDTLLSDNPEEAVDAVLKGGCLQYDYSDSCRASN